MTSRDYFAAELDRRIANLILIGSIASVDLEEKTVSVAIDADWTTAPLPWLELRAGHSMSTLSPPDVGEQVLVLSPSGETAAGVVLRGLFSAAMAPPSASPTRDILGQWSDGAVDVYDVASHLRLITIPAGGQCLLQVGASTSITAADGTLTLRVGDMELVVTASAATLQGGPISLAGAVSLGGAGGAAVARVGDLVNLQTGKITSGSTKVTSA